MSDLTTMFGIDTTKKLAYFNVIHRNGHGPAIQPNSDMSYCAKRPYLEDENLKPYTYEAVYEGGSHSLVTREEVEAYCEKLEKERSAIYEARIAKERKERRARNEALFELVKEVAAGLGEPWAAANLMKDEDMDASYPTFEIQHGLAGLNVPRIRAYLSRDGRLVFSGMAPDRSHNVVSWEHKAHSMTVSPSRKTHLIARDVLRRLVGGYLKAWNAAQVAVPDDRSARQHAEGVARRIGALLGAEVRQRMTDEPWKIWVHRERASGLEVVVSPYSSTEVRIRLEGSVDEGIVRAIAKELKK